MKRWYEWDRSEIVFCTIWCIALFAIFGFPKGWGWAGLPIGLLIGKAIAGRTVLSK